MTSVDAAGVTDLQGVAAGCDRGGLGGVGGPDPAPLCCGVPLNASHAVHLGQPTVLVVEDDADDQDQFLEALDEIGARVRVEFLADGEQLLARCSGSTASLPDLVFLDLHLPNGSGLEVLRRLRDTAWGRSLVVLVYTTSWSEQEITLAYEAGANAYLLRPLRYQELLDLLQRTLDFWLATAQIPVRSPR